MKNITYKRPSTIVTCAICKKEFSKENRAITRSLKVGAKNYCSRKCSGTNSILSIYPKQTQDAMRYYTASIKKRATRKNMEMNIDLKYLNDLFKRQDGKCAISGVSIFIPSDHLSRKNHGLNVASVDRIDNDLGYTKGNIQFTALGINFMRNTLSIAETKRFLNEIRDS